MAKAYKRKAKAAHPDRNGGDSTEFLAVQKCYDLLSDANARDRFDRTGEWADKKPDNTASQIMQIINAAFETVVPSLISQGVNPAKVDILKQMIDYVWKPISGIKKQRKQLEKSIESLKDIAGRFVVDEGENTLRRIVENQIHCAEEQLKRANEMINIQEQALAVLKRFKYNFDPPKFDEVMKHGSRFFEAMTPSFDQVLGKGEER